MEEQNDQNLNPEPTEIEEELEEEEFSHTDKMVGVFTEPVNTFTKMAKQETHTTDWVIPLLVFIVLLIASTVIMQTNPQIKYDMVEKQIEQVEKGLDEAVKNGQMTQDQADTQIEQTRGFMENAGAAMLIPQVIGILIISFIVFFVVSGYYFALSKFGLKGEGTYKESMVGYGLPFYIAGVQVILVLILSMVMNKMLTDTSVASFIDADKTQILGFLLSKLDPLSIWFYFVVSIGLSRMFKAENCKNYVIMVFVSWIAFSLVFFYLAKAVPALSFMNM